MLETRNEDYGSGQSSMEENSNGETSHLEALTKWRSSDQVENGSTLPYCDIDEIGSKHSELYGKHTWKIEKFSKVNKREHCSDVFDAGGYEWFILMYPLPCDVSNNLSLYLCVANPEKHRPGWSIYVQFTIALVNKDPKKSEYSDTLKSYREKESNWGWSKFIELPKLQEGFIDDLDSLIIKAQVQVIRERVDRPFRCLSSQYRRELVRVYLPNVEKVLWQFMEEERSMFKKLIEDKKKWPRFRAFWSWLDQNTRRKMSRDKMDVVLNKAAKLFFILEKSTTTLVMDSLYSGWKAIEYQTKKKKSRQRLIDNVEFPIASVDQDMFVLVDDLLVLIQKTAIAVAPIKEEKGSQNPSKVGNVGEEYSKEAIIRDESRLTEIGRRTLEILVLAHIYSNRVDVAYQEHNALMIQEELINEEEEERKQKAKRGTTDKETKSKKKQDKQKKNKKEKRKEEKVISLRDVEKEESVRATTESSADTLGDPSDVHCKVDDASEIHHPQSGDARNSSISRPSGVEERKYNSVPYKGNVLNLQSKNWRIKGKTQPRKVSDATSLATEREDQLSRHASNPKSQNHSSETRRVGDADVVKTMNPREHNPVSKDRDTVQTQEKSPKASPWNLPSVPKAKPEKRNVDTIPNRKPISSRSPLSDQASPSRDIQFQTVDSRAAVQDTTSLKPSMSRAQSYKHAVVGSLRSDHSSSQAGLPINVGSVDDSSGGLLRNVGSTSNIDSTATTTSSGDHRMNAFNTPVSSSMRQNDVQSLMTDEYRHLDFINDLLEEEHGLIDASGYLVPQGLTQTYTEYMSGSASFFSSSPYGNRQMDGLTQQTQTQTANMDLSLLTMRRQHDASAVATYPYLDVDSSNPNMSAGINGFRDFRPWNGH